VFDIDSTSDEEYAVRILSECGFEEVEVMARDYEKENIYINYTHTKPIPLHIRDRLNELGVIC
jgi:hypothetical protein